MALSPRHACLADVSGPGLDLANGVPDTDADLQANFTGAWLGSKLLRYPGHRLDPDRAPGVELAHR